MATKYWIGTTGNWGTSGNWSPANAPSSGDTVIFDGRVSQSAITAISEGNDQSAVDLAAMYIMNSYTGSIGTASYPLLINVAGKLIVEGTGTYHIKAGNASSANHITELYVNAPRATVNLSTENTQANTITSTWVHAVSALNIAANTKCTNVYIHPSTGSATVTMLAGCTTTLFEQSGGTSTIYSAPTTLNLTGGTCTFGGTADDVEAATDTITTATITGGTFNWTATAAPAPVITTLNVWGGTFDASDHGKTITTAPTITNSSFGPKATINLDNGYANFVFTNAPHRYGTTTIKTSTGQALSLA